MPVNRILGYEGEENPAFDEASGAIIDALNSGNPLPSSMFHGHFAIYNDHLYRIANDTFIKQGVEYADVFAKEAVQKFHWQMAFGGFMQHLSSRRQRSFSRVARAVMRDICRSMTIHPDCDGTCH